jgi:hypothetical protein
VHDVRVSLLNRGRLRNFKLGHYPALALATVAAYVRRKLADEQFPRSVANLAGREAIDCLCRRRRPNCRSAAISPAAAGRTADRPYTRSPFVSFY